jgi:hypothetical protein
LKNTVNAIRIYCGCIHSSTLDGDIVKNVQIIDRWVPLWIKTSSNTVPA